MKNPTFVQTLDELVTPGFLRDATRQRQVLETLRSKIQEGRSFPGLVAELSRAKDSDLPPRMQTRIVRHLWRTDDYYFSARREAVGADQLTAWATEELREALMPFYPFLRREAFGPAAIGDANPVPAL